MSYYTSITGLKNAQTDLAVISHNIANAETAGFKKSSTTFADIVATSVLTDPSLTIGIGARVSAITQNFALGPIEQTGSSLDVAINGDGFFTVQAPDTGEISYTRAGEFRLDSEGYVKTAYGDRLQVFPTDASGNVTSMTTLQSVQMPTSNATGADFAGVNISNKGEVSVSYSDGTSEIVGVVAIGKFLSPEGLRQRGGSTWSATGLSGSPSYAAPGTGQFGSLLSGSIERSNVDIAEELVGLITAQRTFQANAKAIDTATQISQTIIQLRS
ncbi:MAG: flagellar hook-basal body complex protein [Novosphingobium sp.]|uniref:flagellar hook-basal body complex protein n=1 Tax=Novosphingobium sp. TaxID=1874826 RepID=UPI003B9CC287